jgi:hypothetical protein
VSERQEERLSLSPCGDEVWRGEVPSLDKEGRVVVKRNFFKQGDTISVMLGIILEPNAKKLKKTNINLTLVKGIFQWATYKSKLLKLQVMMTC